MDRPRAPSPAGRRRRAGPLGAVLAPGAGADRDQPTLVALDTALSSTGMTIRRMDFPYRRAGRRAPDRPDVLVGAIEQEARALAEQLGTGTGRLLLGGRSMGGRMCSMAVAAGLPAFALVLVSYPLHPPGRPDQLRTAHFPDLRVPCLFVSGTRDTFATPGELEAAASAIPGSVTHHWVTGGDHGLRAKDPEVVGAVLAWLSKLRT